MAYIQVSLMSLSLMRTVPVTVIPAYGQDALPGSARQGAGETL